MLYLISLLSFLLPTQLALHVNSLRSTVYGFQIDYLIPTLYLTDIISLLIIIFGFRYLKINKSFKLYALCYMVFVAVNILISSYLVPSAYKWFKVTEMLLLGVVIFNTKKFDVFKNFIKPLSYSIFIACLLGIMQFINKGSIGGIFYWFGERSFVFNDPNIAPYPYATFSHPNSFAGFLLVFGIFLLQYRKKFVAKYFWISSVLVGINLILTNSLNVYITIAVLLLVLLKKSSVFLFLPFDLSQRFVTHRLELINAAFTIVKENFWFGVGLNNFIPNLVKVSNTFVNSWELQPVHNIFLLVFSETGVIGLYALCFMLYGTLTAYNLPLIAILITGLSDHYWLTLQQNMLLFTYVLAISKRQC
ncbi:MAG: O-antigen ligase family protein [Patescibacteria group bacterium]